jgi:hypothetical protein
VLKCPINPITNPNAVYSQSRYNTVPCNTAHVEKLLTIRYITYNSQYKLSSRTAVCHHKVHSHKSHGPCLVATFPKSMHTFQTMHFNVTQRRMCHQEYCYVHFATVSRFIRQCTHPSNKPVAIATPYTHFYTHGLRTCLIHVLYQTCRRMELPARNFTCQNAAFSLVVSFKLNKPRRFTSQPSDNALFVYC